MKEIQLTQGQVALVDDEDYERIAAYKWCAHYRPNRGSGKYSAVRNERRGGKSYTLLMHRVVLNAPAGLLVDHIDRNPLNNQKSNLRYADHSSNGANTGPRKTNTTGYKGVTYCKDRGEYCAQITVRRKAMNLGRFKTAEKAAEAYKAAAQKFFGSFAATK